MAATTALQREQSAQKLESRGRALARDRLLWGSTEGPSDFDETMWRLAHERVLSDERTAGGWSGPLEPLDLSRIGGVGVERGDGNSRPVKVPSNDNGSASDVPFHRMKTKPERGGRPIMNLRRCVKWHSSRAANKRALFKRVDECGEAEGARITLVCRGCKDKVSIEVGCGSTWFCAACRKRAVLKFRKGFERSRLGLVTAATRAGLTRRKQKKGARWGEKLLTVTLPHRGDARERIETLQATWARFWRTLGDRLRPELQGPSGITVANVPRGFPKNFEKRADASELKLLDVLSYLHVFEWTPGDDGQGHPHMHVWLFSRFLDQKMLKRLWEHAYVHVLRAQRAEGGWSGPIQEPDLVVDIRAAGDDVAHELVKYLTKDWEISSSGARRAAPEIFAQVYATLDGRRRRQSSAAFSMWAVEQFNACPCCGYERERGHWARLDIEHALDEAKVKEKLGQYVRVGHYLTDDGTYQPMPLAGAAEYELRATFDAQRDQEWLDSFELRVLRAAVNKHMGVRT